MSTVSIISYNTHLFGGTIAGQVSEGYKDDERLTEIIARVRSSNADIVCLCEVWPTSYKKLVCLQAGYPYHFWMESSILAQADGMVVLSRFPLQQEGFLMYRDLSITSSDYLSRKGVLVLTVHGDGGRQFRVLFTHTQAQDDERKTRMLNLDQIRHAIHAHYPGTPAIILGDLNVGAVEYDEMKGKFTDFTDAYKEKNSDPGYTCDPKTNPLAKKFAQINPERYDYILTSAKDWTVNKSQVIADWKLNNEDLSDHYPVRADLTLNRLNAAPGWCNSEAEAKALAQEWKTFFGDGVSNLIVVHNNTGATLTRQATNSWYGDYSLWPTHEVPPGKYVAVFHHKPLTEPAGSTNGFIYRIGSKADVFCTFDVPWIFTSSNKIYCEVRDVDHWANKKHYDAIAKLLDNGGKSQDTQDPRTDKPRYGVKARMESGTSPTATVEIYQV